MQLLAGPAKSLIHFAEFLAGPAKSLIRLADFLASPAKSLAHQGQCKGRVSVVKVPPVPNVSSKSFYFCHQCPATLQPVCRAFCAVCGRWLFVLLSNKSWLILPCYSVVIISSRISIHRAGRATLSSAVVPTNRGAMSSSRKPAMPQPIRVTRKVSSGCALA